MAQFVFIIVILISQISTCWTIRAILTNNYVYDGAELPLNYVDELVRYLCKDDVISLNFSNKEISAGINQDFISGSLITCLNLMGNIQSIAYGAFNKLPNLTHLFLSNSRLRSQDELLNFGGHNKLQVLIIDKAIYSDIYSDYSDYYNPREVHISGDYPNLKILFFRKICFSDLSFFSFPKLEILDLSGNDITGTNFVEFLPSSLYFLDLHDNSLNSLHLSKRMSKLLALNLKNNRFNSIKNNEYSLSVADLKALQYLSVSENKINSIDSGAFQDNNNLLYLNLSTNYINYLHPKTFANLQYLKTLDLSNNTLEEVPQISNETEISVLYINHNNIKKIISYAFAQMPKLTKLLMGKNQIDEIDIDAFAFLSILEELDLSTNILSFLPDGWAKSLVSLKYLDLSDNKFTSLESLSLTSALPITEMYLMMNPLEYLNVRYFEDLPQNLTINLINKSKFAKVLAGNEKLHYSNYSFVTHFG
ncbi:PREDICTED: leucine-rich repeat-containing G-protein coupled receptor 5-like [Wasmannia auropunctata]|uniref:leucine-rich repeat-containing G-protein coupled receptor 5-like n=1 Tax=Wasmannia auropunctata TaxID=64793 RepID=UPI0005F064CF|nr:PREDICTED: leucine-rich repeat-containing G-protein coupled receptor 5-like [Wasmannia auropunctata]